MKKWEILNELRIKKDELRSEDLIKILLENRGLKTKKEIDDFLNPTLENFTADGLGINKKALEKSIARILEAIHKKEQIIVFGDYDVDGVTGAAILWETLTSIGANVMPYIPHRVDEGYGLSKKGIDNVLEKYPETKLIITVDNGIVANDSVDYANNLAIEVIITDHHTLSPIMPKAYSIIHTTQICGAGVAFLLVREISKSKFQISNEIKILKSKIEDGEYLDLVALATVADVMPLLGLNRSLLVAGLPYLRKTKRPGLIALFEIAKIKPEDIGVYEIGHVIAPRLNASGRLEHAMESLRLLCTKNKQRADGLAHLLNETNHQRQLITFDSFAHAKEKVEGKNKLLFVYSETYAPGVIGLIAGKLTEEYYRPSIALSVGETYSKASARSVSGFNIIEFIRTQSSLLVDAGGHPMAAGFTVETSKLKDLELAVLKAAEQIDEGLLIRKIKIDCELPINFITPELFFEINKLSPFGHQNYEPVFLGKDLVIESLRLVGKESKHLKLELGTKNNEVRFGAILFGYDTDLDLKKGDSVEVAYSISENNWNGNKKLELKIRDIKRN